MMAKQGGGAAEKMSMRQWYKGMVANGLAADPEVDPKKIAAMAAQVADALVKEDET